MKDTISKDISYLLVNIKVRNFQFSKLSFQILYAVVTNDNKFETHRKHFTVLINYVHPCTNNSSISISYKKGVKLRK